MRPIALAALTACLLLPPATQAQAQNRPDSLSPCWLVKHQLNLKSIQRNARKIISGDDDNCDIALIDKLTDSSLGANYYPYLRALDAICKVSDGAIGEYFDEVGAKLFHKNFDHVFKYIYKKNSTCNSSFENMLIEAVGIELSESKNKAGEQAKLAALLKKKESDLAMNDQQRSYVERLKQKIWSYSDN